MSGVQRGPAVGDSSTLANHFHLVHRKECSRKPSMCGPEAGREKWITVSREGHGGGATLMDSLILMTG